MIDTNTRYLLDGIAPVHILAVDSDPDADVWISFADDPDRDGMVDPLRLVPVS